MTSGLYKTMVLVSALGICATGYSFEGAILDQDVIAIKDDLAKIINRNPPPKAAWFSVTPDCTYIENYGVILKFLVACEDRNLTSLFEGDDAFLTWVKTGLGTLRQLKQADTVLLVVRVARLARSGPPQYEGIMVEMRFQNIVALRDRAITPADFRRTVRVKSLPASFTSVVDIPALKQNKGDGERK